MPTFSAPNFRAQFPAFADPEGYPDASLQFAWDMGTNWISQCPSCFGMRPAQLQQATDLMAGVLLYQLFGPQVGGEAQASQQGGAPGPVTSATEGSVSASFQIPAVGSSGFNSLLLGSPPYGKLLLALLNVAASVGGYIRSCRPSYIPP